MYPRNILDAGYAVYELQWNHWR